MMTKLLRKLTHDVPVLNENTVVPLRVGSLSFFIYYICYKGSHFSISTFKLTLYSILGVDFLLREMWSLL